MKCKMCNTPLTGHIESGYEIITEFKNGISISSERMPLPKRVYCCVCGDLDINENSGLGD